MIRPSGLILWAAVGLSAATTTTTKKLDFNRDVRPILSDRCFACHGPDETSRKAGLRLDTRAGLLERKGVVVGGQADASRLIKRVMAKAPPTRMPPTGEALTDRQIQTLKQWINEGAVWEDHWSYVPPKKAAEPVIKNPAWAKTAIDKFVLARLEREGLKPSPEADRATLLRRLSLDLTGLPPSPEEVRAFVADRSPDAYEKQVDRLLASPRYGERMAMQWLDLARYADTHGFHIDSHRDMWRWRDWVIRAFNENKPYDRFTVEQIAGDLLPGATKDQMLATGFSRNHMINFEGGAIPEEYQAEYIVDRVDTTATVFLGMTMGCARCHDHKYDPIRQKEFYQFGAFFNTIPEKGLDGQRGNAEPVLAFPTDHQTERKRIVEQRIPEVEKRLKEKDVDEAFARWQSEVKFTLPSREGLLAHYEFEGGLSDSSGHYRHGRGLLDDFSYPAAVTGGRAADLDGRSIVELTALPMPKTMAFWFTTQARLGVNGILHRMQPDRRGWEIFLDDPYPIPRLLQTSRFLIRKIERWPDRVWEARNKKPVLVRGMGLRKDIHVAIVNGGEALYLDGVRHELEVTRNTLTGPFVESSGPITIGGPTPDDRLRGRVDDLRFYDRALEAEEIRALADYGPVSANLALPAAKRSKDQEAALRDYFLAHGAPAEMRALQAELKKLRAEKSDLDWEIETSMVMAEAAKPRDTYVLARGDYRNKTEKVTPAVPAALPPLPSGAPANRLGLAQWLVSAENPLVARVAVNRFWQLYFGQGLTKTSEDLGSQGAPPTHPELLDWLAVDFRENGWDVKRLQKQIVMSAAYRQSSKWSPLLKEKDPENRLLARGPRFRLPAESVRDVALAASGLLTPAIGGKSVFPYQPPGVWEELAYGAEFSAQFYEQSHGADLYRRSMYTFWKRTAPPASLATFDAPDREKCSARRPLTNTPLQALVLMNDPTYVEAARALAARVIKEGGAAPAKRIERAFDLVLARRPAAKELALVAQLAKQKLADYERTPDQAAALLKIGESPVDPGLRAPELAAWTVAMSAILNLDETITKE
ncbi:MAG: DUF1553 domain-containing protein [Bryobacteraceae bacterium]|nr:DUF1553 domain-containing protein [Bryobacteraceae bacterium]